MPNTEAPPTSGRALALLCGLAACASTAGCALHTVGMTASHTDIPVMVGQPPQTQAVGSPFETALCYVGNMVIVPVGDFNVSVATGSKEDPRIVDQAIQEHLLDLDDDVYLHIDGFRTRNWSLFALFYLRDVNEVVATGSCYRDAK
jgi:hypothetical protein